MTGDGVITVVIVDDQPMIRLGLRSLLEAEHDMTVVADVEDGERAVTEVCRLKPDVVLMDIRMPRLDGIEATRRLLNGPDASAAKVIILTTFGDEEYVLGGLRAGASAFLVKDAQPDAIIAAVRRVKAGEGVLDPSVTQSVIRRLLQAEAEAWAGTGPASDSKAQSARDRDLERLSGREIDVLRQVAAGASNRTIALTLFLTEATVKTHVHSMLTKLDLVNRAQLVVLAFETGLVSSNSTGI
jgi:DNA-binding NarL/FixJ family response regulator